MAVISVLRKKGNNVIKSRLGTLKNISIKKTNYHFAKANEVDNGICENAVDEPIRDVQITGNTIQAELPVEYQRIEYIESTGTQYIDTGITPNQDTGFDVEFLTKNQLSAASGEYGCIFGARTGSSVDELQLTTFTNSTDKGILRFGKGSYNAGITTGEVLTASLRNKVFTNGEVTVIDLYPYEFTSGGTITVFALNNNGNITQHGSVQIFSLKLYNLDILIRDFIPCYRKADNVAGLYDLVEKKFYTNNGTGEFLKGNVVLGKYGTINIFNPKLITAVRSSPNVTNPYGTTINSLSYNGNSITVTQTNYSDDVDYEGYYGNGVFYIEFDKEDVLVGKTYTLIADINITNNLGNKENIKVISQGGTLKNAPMVNGKIIVSFAQAEAERSLFEVRCNGMSFVLSNIMLIKGEITEAPDYIPCIVNSNADYSIKSVGDKTPNLFNVFNAIQGASYTDRVKLNEDGSLTIYQPTGSSVSDYTKLNQFAPSLEIGKTYVLNFETTGTITASNQIWLLGTNQAWKRGTSRTITESDLNSTVFWYGDGEGQTITISEIQITEGTDTKEFEPYGYKVPIKVSTENLLTSDYFLDEIFTDMYSVENNKVIVNRANTMGWASMKALKLEPNTEYNLSLENEADTDIRTPTNVKLFTRAITKTAVFTTDETGLVCFKFFSNDGTTYPYEIGSVNLWHENTTNIYLNEQLRKVGDYADYIDYKNKKVVRNVGTKILNGSESWQSYIFGDSSTNTYLVNIDKMSKGTRQPFLSNLFATNLYYSSSGQLDNTITFGFVTSSIYVKYNSVSNTEEFKTFLSNNNLKIVFGLVEPTEETINMPEISTFDGTTTISSETEIEPSEIKVNYWKQI